MNTRTIGQTLLWWTCVESELQLPHSCPHIIRFVEHQYTMILLVPIPSKFRACSLAASAQIDFNLSFAFTLSSPGLVKQARQQTQKKVL